MNKKVFSGIQPSGNLHIGNYLGTLKNWVSFQSQYDNIFCVVDLHAITVPQDPKQLNQKIRELAALYLASGVDPKLSIMFVQSHVSAHSELGWILNCFTPMGWIQRMTQYKDKSKKLNEQVNVGLFDYPVLMAADIILYDTDLVPVGEDQKQHVEITRDIAGKYNSTFGETFKLPEVMLPKVGARVMSLGDPTKKMSKSDSRLDDAIYLTDSVDNIRSKIMKATTDSQNEVKFDQNRLGINNLLEIYECFSGLDKAKIENKFIGKGYKEFKEDLSEVIATGLKPLQQKYQEFVKDPAQLDMILKQGADKARPVADKKLAEVKQKVGLG